MRASIIFLCGLLCQALVLTIPERLAALPATNGTPATGVTNTGATNGEIRIEGKVPVRKENDALMQALGKERTRTFRARRFEIVFFVSLPVTLWLTWSLMEFWIRNTRDVNNPKREFQSPHYIYMFSTSVITSFYIAIEDQKRYGKSEAAGPPEKKVEIPIIGIRF